MCSVCVVRSSAGLLAIFIECPVECVIGSSKRTPGVAGDGCGPNNETRTFSLPSLKSKEAYHISIKMKETHNIFNTEIQMLERGEIMFSIIVAP